MVTLQEARASNSQFRPKSRPVVVVMGGTSGVGEGIVKAFARHTHGAVHIIIVGRSQAAADAIIASLPRHAESTYEFVALDASLLRNVRAFCRDLLQRLDKINFLVLSQGLLVLNAPPTEDGLDPNIALMMHGRARAALDLGPLLRAAASRGEDARVLTIGNVGVGGPLDLDDLALRKVRLAKGLGTYSTYADIITLELAVRLPDVAVTHAYPGWVRSRGYRGLPFLLRWLLWPIVSVVAISPEESGEWMMYALLDPDARTGAWFKRGHGEKIEASKYADAVTREAVWKHIEEKTDV